MRTVCDSDFQTDGAENRKARLEKSVLMNNALTLLAERQEGRATSTHTHKNHASAIHKGFPLGDST